MTDGLPRPRESVRSRSKLLSLLTQACELEHGLACSYLFAAFTLKQDLAEGGLSWLQLQKVRLWAAQVYFVAAEEMLHLAQVWNLQTAIGGTPYYLRPNFPLPTNYYPLNLPVVLERFSLTALDRFIQYERPADVELAPESPIIGWAAAGFNSVGDLYGRIASGFEAIAEDQLFLGDPSRQIGPELIDFPNIVKVRDRKSALAAIHTITEQGEGIPTDRDDSHFGMFRQVRLGYLQELADAERGGHAFHPVRPSISNPIARIDPVFEAEGANQITHPYSAAVADAFDSVYGLMLRSLQYVFDNATSDAALLRELSLFALELMTTVLKPLGEALTLLPAGAHDDEYEGQAAGPGFALARHVPLPLAPNAARILVREKVSEVAALLNAAAGDSRAPSQLRGAARNITEMAARRGVTTLPDAALGTELQLPHNASGDRGPDGRSVPLSTA
jgi:hypothetical protein